MSRTASVALITLDGDDDDELIALLTALRSMMIFCPSVRCHVGATRHDEQKWFCWGIEKVVSWRLVVVVVVDPVLCILQLIVGTRR